MKCNVDHGALTTRFCPHCGASTAPMKERGDIMLMLQKIKDIDIGQTGYFNPLRAVVNIMITIETLEWVLGASSDARLIALLTDPKNIEERRG